jgi:hypothetical protein
MPARSGKPPEEGSFGGCFGKVERLRIEFGGEALDIVTGDFGFTAAVPHADCQVVEPLDHDILLRLDLDHSLPSP